MDEKNNQELSVDELLAKLRSSLMEESSAAEAETPAPKAEEAVEAPEPAADTEPATEPEPTAETSTPIVETPTADAAPETESAAPAPAALETDDTAADEAADAVSPEAETAAAEPETPTAAAQPLPEVDENDIFAAWGLRPDDLKKEKQKAAAAAENAPAEDTGYTSPTAKRTLRYRIARVEKKDDFAARKQTETQKESVDFDRTDYTLIKQALGMEKPAEGWTDTDTAFEVEHSVLHRRAARRVYIPAAAR